MDTSKQPRRDEEKHQFVVATTLRLAFLALLILLSFLIIKPFIMIVAWGIIIAVGIYPLYRKLANSLGNKTKLSATIITLFMLAIIIVPSVLFTSGTIEGFKNLANDFNAGTLEIPPVPAEVADWPVIGTPLYEIWELATQNLEGAVVKLEPQIREYGPKLASAIAGFGLTVLQFIISVIIAGALLVSSKSSARAAGNIFRLLVGDDGEAFTNLAEKTIRSVFQGVLGIAVIQAILAGAGMLAVGMPGTGIWVLLILILAIMQLPTMLVMLPVAIYVFTIADTTPAVIFLIWSILVGLSDNFLKPLLLGRGVDVPMLVILLGAIGGMILSGIIGLFVGAVVLAITYKVFGAVIRRGDDLHTAESKIESNNI